MKRILSLYAIIPFIIFAQPKTINSTQLPLIESITSDTVNGKFYQVLFSYDQNYRVIGITHKVLKITTIEKKQTIKITEEINEIFEYAGNSKLPYVRKTGNSAYDNATKNWYTDFSEEQYFLFKKGKRVGDSTLSIKEHNKKIGTLEQTDKGIFHEMDLRPPFNPNKYEAPNTYSNDFYLKSPLNIGEEISRHFTGSKWGETTNYSFSTFDSMVNPLKDLNIASILINEKICFPFRGGQNKSEEKNFSFFRGGQYGEKGLGWYFFNQNNPLSYTVDNGETNHYKGIINIDYKYNQFTQPIFAKANIRVVMNGNESYVFEKFQKRFTFRYIQ